MRDSQELTIENFNSEQTNLESFCLKDYTEFKNKPIMSVKDLSVALEMSQRIHNKQDVDSEVKYKEPTPREYNVQPEIMHTPDKISARMATVFIHNPLEV